MRREHRSATSEARGASRPVAPTRCGSRKMIDGAGNPQGLGSGTYGDGAAHGLWGARDEHDVSALSSGRSEGFYSDADDTGDGRGVWMARWSRSRVPPIDGEGSRFEGLFHPFSRRVRISTFPLIVFASSFGPPLPIFPLPFFGPNPPGGSTRSSSGR